MNPIPQPLNTLTKMMTGDQWPQLLDLKQAEDMAELVLQIPADLRWLKGHFPSQPVVAGVVQTDWACRIALCLFNLEREPKRIDNLKFQNVIIPPQTVKLELLHATASQSIHFRYRNPELPDHTFSEGKLVF